MLTCENRFVTSAGWEQYEKFLEAVGERPGIRITYDRGNLEIMTTSPEHEKAKSLIALLLEALLVDRDIDFEPGGSTTFRRQDLDRGLEPDECYWLKNALACRAHGHPTPDLALEVEITSSVINRLEIYRALGVPEVWRYTKKGELIVLRQAAIGYQPVSASVELPGFPAQELARFLGEDKPRPQLVREFLAWSRTIPGGTGPSNS